MLANMDMRPLSAQLSPRPVFGQQLAWGESNAIVFANSVIGARTNRYGDFLDICCAITGRAPNSGLHTNEGRHATIHVIVDVPDRVLDDDMLYPILGHVLGEVSGTRVPVLTGLDERASEDRLKALGAASASSGAVALFHVVGVTPEAPSLNDATGGEAPREELIVDVDTLGRARDGLNHGVDGPLGAVSVGTPHFSAAQLSALSRLVDGRKTSVPFYISTGRDVLKLAESRGDIAPLSAFGATIVTDTCTYITPIMGDVAGVVMTDSAKWAYYAPGNLGVSVALGSLADCVESAVSGSIVTGTTW